MKDGVPYKYRERHERRYQDDDENIECKQILLCPHCGKGAEIAKYYVDSKHIKCPHCGEMSTVDAKYNRSLKTPEDLEDIYANGILIDGKHAIVLTTRHPLCFTRKINYWLDDDKLTVSIERVQYQGLGVKGQYWIKKRFFKNRIVFNFKTGQSYLFRDIDSNGKPIAPKEPRIKNISLGQCHAGILQLDKLLKDIGIKVFGKDRVEAIDRYTKQYDGINIVSFARLNYFSCFDTEQFKKILPHINQYMPYSTRRDFSFLKKLQSTQDTNLLPKYMQKKSVKRHIAKNPMNYIVYKYLHYFGIKDINIINRFIDTVLESAPHKYSACIGCLLNRASVPDTKAFVKWLINGKDAKGIYSSLVSLFGSKNFWLFNDATQMMNNIVKNGGVLPDNHGSLKEIHDLLTVEDRHIRFKNREISYSEKELSLAHEYDNYSFELPKDTDTLYEIGRVLSICVGSYGNNAIAKQCTIVAVKKDNKYTACIELRPFGSKYKMVQLKARFNHTVTDINPVNKWIEDTEISVENCCDYDNAVNGDKSHFDEREYDYHVNNPRLVDQRQPQIADDDIEDVPLPF